MVGYDLANCQPLLAGLVAVDFHRNKMSAHRLRHRRFSEGANPYRARKWPPPRHFKIRSDLEAYLELCERGELYESLGNRERIKKQFMTAMFGKPVYHDSVKEQLVRLYPSVAEMLASLKAKTYQHAAHVIQNVEASIFIGTICQELMRGQPNMPIITIHDSLMTTPEHLHVVRDQMMEAFQSANLSPKLRHERWDLEYRFRLAFAATHSVGSPYEPTKIVIRLLGLVSDYVRL